MSDDTLMSDGELCGLVREGDQDAFGVLYSRHAPLAFAIARQSVDSFDDADDVVADAFHAVLDKLRAGDGPDTFFRAYLLQVVRRTAYARNRSAGRALPTSDDWILDGVEAFEDPALNEFENQAAARAFRSLPERWQEVLWYLDVEGQKPAAVAPVMGLSANAVSALAVRARDALRREYLQAHVSDDVPERCRPYRDKLGAYARHSLSRGAERKVRVHLDECPKCTAILVELGDIGSTMKAALLPLIIGVGPVAWWLSPAGQGAVAASLTGVHGLVAGAAGVAGAGAASGAGAGASAGASASAAAAGTTAGTSTLGIAAAVTAAVVAVGLVIVPAIAASWQQQTPPTAAPASTAPEEQAVAQTPTVRVTAASATPGAAPSSTPSASPSGIPVVLVQPPLLAPALPTLWDRVISPPAPATPVIAPSSPGTATPGHTVTAGPGGTPTETPSGTPTPTVTATTTPAPTFTPSPSTTPPGWCQPWWAHPECWLTGSPTPTGSPSPVN
ncbi:MULTISPECIES: sigma-70 family RNA polymerase sigma factor [Arthrobacter]|uniref:Sigma-70 family RNA polymerase sigma factor n=2 Tax=Arthrobacter TaxID=1663 RepID=A0ABU9KHQ0_9MICC|nr:sigma-70 family RNA polymerase sigma factor [Arthrobacter sp. YJM1]MDP5226577.1 sigma-70 family RNA polymerase sigma factor [Arthrobacter sp. YJM1]